MTAFILISSLLLVLVSLFLLAPLTRQKPLETSASLQQRETTLAILREQLADLEREKAAQSLSDAEFAQSREDLQRRILEEGRAPEAAPATPRARLPLWLPGVALVLLFACSLSGYLWLGNPRALSEAARAPGAEASMSAEQIDAMLAQLEQRLQDNPGDENGWIMLGRSYKTLNRPAEAVQAFEKVGKARLDQDPGLLIDYAEALAAVQGNLKGRPAELVHAALKLAPDYGQALFLAGVIAYEDGKKLEAADHWEKLLPAAKESDPETYELLKTKIAELRATGDGKQKTGDGGK